MHEISPIEQEVDNCTENLSSPPRIWLQQIPQCEISKPNWTQQIFDFAIEIKNPNGICMIVRVLQQLQSTKPDLPIQIIPENQQERTHKKSDHVKNRRACLLKNCETDDETTTQLTGRRKKESS